MTWYKYYKSTIGSVRYYRVSNTNEIEVYDNILAPYYSLSGKYIATGWHKSWFGSLKGLKDYAGIKPIKKEEIFLVLL